MNKNEPVFYDGRDVGKVAERVEATQPGHTVVVKPENVDLSNIPKIPYYPY